MLEAGLAAGKAGVQVGVRRGNFFCVIGMDGEDNTFVELVVNLGQLVAFVLVDDEQISRRYGIEAVVDEKLLPAGNGIVLVRSQFSMAILQEVTSSMGRFPFFPKRRAVTV